MKIKLFKQITLPTKKRESDAGWDVYLPEDITFKAAKNNNGDGVTTVDLGFGVALPKGYAGLFAMRSSVCKTGLQIQAPLIDEGYLGELHLIICNYTDHDITYKKDERVCSLFVYPVYNDILEVVDDLGTSDRNANWNGSSGR